MTRLAIAIDKLQPLRSDTVDAIRAACARHDEVLVLIAGAQRPRDWRYPYSWQERAALLHEAVRAPNLTTLPLIDTLYDDGLWVSHVRRCLDVHASTSVERTLLVAPGEAGKALARLFPDWGSEAVLPGADHGAALARLYANGHAPGINPDTWSTLARSAKAIGEERERWANAERTMGYAIPLNTVDAVVVQSHHVLLTERAPDEVGAGLLALPGAFLAPQQTALAAILAAVRSKAGLDMPTGALSGRLAERHVFDHPDRDPRGWVRTEAFVFHLPASGRMEQAKRATWVPLAHIDPSRLFADHGDIIQACTRGVIAPQEDLLAAALTIRTPRR